jgi:hypothetical protein
MHCKTFRVSLKAETCRSFSGTTGGNLSSLIAEGPEDFRT